ncbi:MAG: tetratricopeptide repeat protein [Bdellovibrionota bacterium]
MFSSKFTFSLCVVLALFSRAHASTADQIRSKAPMTALVYDLREGNIASLENAFLENEIDFFLDYEGVANSSLSSLYYLRAAAKKIRDRDYGAASNLLKSVRSHANQKAYLEAVILAMTGKLQPAMQAFQTLLKNTQNMSPRLRNLTLMGAARVAHELGNYSQAIFYYSKVSQLDPLFFQAVYEKAWSFYMDGDMNGALGATLAFMTPYSNSMFFPEGPIIRAAAFYHLCMYERANEVIENMKSSYLPLQAQIQELRRRAPQTWLFDERVLETADKRILSFMIADPTFRSLQRAYLSLIDETKTLSGAQLSVANEALAFVRRSLVAEANRVLNLANTEIQEALKQADMIQIEILQLGVNVLVGAPIEMRDDLSIIDLGNVDFSELVQFWPFQGEFWFDELGSYYYGLKSQCGS